MPFNLFRAVRFITVFKEWLCLLSCTNRICFRGYHSQQFSSHNSVGLMYSSKYLWWGLSNSPGTSTVIYWETLAGMQPQIAPQLTLLTAGVITQGREQLLSASPGANVGVVPWWHTGWQSWQKLMFASTFSSLLFHDFITENRLQNW